MKTTAVFFPFDLFGSPGAGTGALLLADACRELLADNKQEKLSTRARCYQDQVRLREFNFETLSAYAKWREQGRQAARQALHRREFLIWVTGNHLGVLPVYEELGELEGNTIVIQLDAHLDIYNLSDCKADPSHGNFLLHAEGSLPDIINAGHREQLLRADYIRKHYQAHFPASALAVDPGPALRYIRTQSARAKRVFLDIDCDVFDPAYFPAVSDPLPFGLTPQQVLLLADAAWSERIVGVAFSEFDAGRDHRDQSLATLVWLVEHFLLKRYEGSGITA